MNKIKGFTLMELMIVIIIIMILILIVTPYYLKSRILANDNFAKSTLVTLSKGTQVFASTRGYYPSDITSLTGATPPILPEDYCGATASGYIFTCTFGADSYSFQATPIVIDKSGTTTFTITTGGVLIPKP
jgi:prepilin-type N-terminal cleavage/methylation domain-containing protein